MSADSANSKSDFTGPVFIFAAVFLTVGLFVLSKPDLSFASVSHLFLTGSQLFALIGIVLLSLSYLLSSRAGFLEPLFGGLDRIYNLHHLLGVIAFVLVINHPILLAVNALPNSKLALLYLIPSFNNLPYDLGAIALFSLILLISITLFIRLPYHLWKATHEYMGLVILFAALHAATITSDVSRYFPLKFWVLFVATLGLVSYFYRRFLYERFGPVYFYRVSSAVNFGSVTELQFTPQGKPLIFRPGQFVFLNFPGFPGYSEPHPFSISSAPDNPILRLSIKASGDYTKKLNGDLPKAGQIARLLGPYGQFSARFASCDTAVCIAGGIGITPFISLFESRIRPAAKPSYLFYSVKTESEAYYHPALDSLSKALPFYYRLSESQSSGRLTASGIIKMINIDPKSATYFICGPLPMMLSLRDQLLDLGVRPARIIFEDFSFK